MSNPYLQLSVDFSIHLDLFCEGERRIYKPPVELIMIARQPIKENTSSMNYYLEGTNPEANREIWQAREKLASDIGKAIRHQLLFKVLNVNDTVNGWTNKKQIKHEQSST